MSARKKFITVFLCVCMALSSACSAKTSIGASGDLESIGGEISGEGGGDNGVVSGGESGETGNGTGGAEGNLSAVPVCYGEAAKAEAKRTFVSAAERAYNREGVAFTEKNREKFENYAEKYVLPVFEAESIIEEHFSALLSELNKEGDTLFNAMYALYKGTETAGKEISSLCAFLVRISKKAGMTKTMYVVFELISAYFDAKTEEYTEKYEKYGYAHYLRYAEEEQRKKKTLLEEIGKENFAALTTVVVQSADQLKGFFGGENNEGEAYSGEKTLFFIRICGARISNLTITKEGWRVCLRVAGTAFRSLCDENTHLFLRMLAAVCAEDYGVFCAAAGDLAAAIGSAAIDLEKTDLAYIENYDFITLTKSVFARFSEKEWERLERVFAVSFTQEIYTALIDRAGKNEEYAAYLSKGGGASFEEWKSSAGTAAFLETSENFLRARAPWLAFALFGL